MEKTINSRIIEVRKYLKINQTDFATQLGITQSLVSKIESETTIVTEHTVRLICMTYGIRYDWLKDGVGNMLAIASEDSDIMEIHSNREKQLVENFRIVSDGTKKMIEEYTDLLVSHERHFNSEKFDIELEPRGPAKQDADSDFVEENMAG